VKSLSGIYPALVTPYLENGSINEESLRRIARLNLDKGVQGFYVGGSTAEAFLLSEEERARLYGIVCDEVKGQCQVICHVGSISTDIAVRLGHEAERVGATAVSAIPPFYYQFSVEEIQAYYREIMDLVPLPMVLYNFPTTTGINLTDGSMSDLLQDERVIGIKHTSQNLFELGQMKAMYPRLYIFNGHDEVFLSGLAAGADGAIGSTYNFMAEKYLNIESLAGKGDLLQARAKQAEVVKIISALLDIGVYQGIKYFLELMGIECGGCRRPFRPLRDSDKRVIRDLKDEYL